MKRWCLGLAVCLSCKQDPVATLPPASSLAATQPAAVSAAAEQGPQAATAPAQGAASASTASNGTAPPSTAARNVILLTIDSLRAEMPWTGYPRDIAPNLTQLARQSVVYPRAYSASSSTPKSVSALLTGRYPSAVYRSGWFFSSFPDSNLFFTEVLQKRGVRTLAGHGHAYFDRGKQVDQGFDVWKLVPGISFDNSTDRHVTSDKMTDLAVQMLSAPETAGKQFFLWLHYMDPHDQYIQHAESPKFGKSGRDRYDAEVFYTDLHVGRLLEYARKQSWWDNTVIIVSADHGEAFGEHGMYKHAFEVWEVITRVPLFFYGPGLKARSIDQRRAAIDLAPTILELMGVKDIPPSFMGRSLVPELQGAEPANHEPIVVELPEDYNNPQRRAIIVDDYKLLVRGDGTRSLFDLKADPGEEKDLSKKQPEQLNKLQKVYDETVAKMQVVAPFGGMKLRSGKLANGPEGP